MLFRSVRWVDVQIAVVFVLVVLAYCCPLEASMQPSSPLPKREEQAAMESVERLGGAWACLVRDLRVCRRCGRGAGGRCHLGGKFGEM